MNFQQIATSFTLVDENVSEASLLAFDDPGEQTVLVQWEEEQAQAEFDFDAPMTFLSNGNITVTDRDGTEHTFSAYVQQRVILSDTPRAINIADSRIEITEPNRLWVKVGKFDVLLNHTDEGIAVDVWPWVPEDAAFPPDEPLATCYAFDTDADDAVMDPDEVAHARMDAEGSE